MIYEEVIFEISPLQPWRDVLIAYLSELPYDSFLETKNGLKAYILNKSFDKAALQEVLKDLNIHVNYHHKTLQKKIGMLLGSLILSLSELVIVV